MPISIIDNFDVNAAKNIDSRLGPYDTTASAKAAIDETTQRYLGLTIVVTGSGNLEEYWFQDGVTDSDLVLKPSSAGEGGIFKQTGSYYATTNDLQVTGSINQSGSLIVKANAGGAGFEVGEFSVSVGGDNMFNIGMGGTQNIQIGGFGDYDNYASSTFHESITASSDISASGNLFASLEENTNATFVSTYNRLTGQFFYTASSAIGGGGGGTDPKYLVYETGSGTDSIKPAHGNGNVASGTRSTVAGGVNNEATQNNAFVGGGDGNCALKNKTAVLGGENNRVCQQYSVGGGGFGNTINSELSGIWSGCNNTTTGNSSAILGGRSNETGGDCSIVGGGSTNSANCTTSGVFSGCTNDVNGNSSAILGGEANEASGDCSIVVGGQLNCAQQTHDFIGGGCNNKTVNTAGSFGNAIVGGRLNEILDAAGNETYLSFIGGGECNKIDAHQSSIVGGINNHIDGQNLNPVYSFIGGGFNNYISSSASNIVGGTQNKIHVGATNSSIVGGVSNRISGSGAQLSNYSAILGGCGNVLKHEKSFIIGANLTSTANCTTFMNNATLEGSISSSATGSFGYVILDYDNMPTSDPNVKGAVYRSGNDLLISAG